MFMVEWGAGEVLSQMGDFARVTLLTALFILLAMEGRVFARDESSPESAYSKNITRVEDLPTDPAAYQLPPVESPLKADEIAYHQAFLECLGEAGVAILPDQEGGSLNEPARLAAVIDCVQGKGLGDKIPPDVLKYNEFNLQNSLIKAPPSPAEIPGSPAAAVEPVPVPVPVSGEPADPGVSMTGTGRVPPDHQAAPEGASSAPRQGLSVIVPPDSQGNAPKPVWIPGAR